MNEIIIPGLYLLSGVAAYSAAAHMSAGLRHPRSYTHITFAGIGSLIILFALSYARTLQATDVAAYTSALRLNLAFTLLLVALIPWFIALYTGNRSLPILVAIGLLSATLLVANRVLPYTLQYRVIDHLTTIHMPWGENLSHGVGPSGGWAYAGVAAAIACFGYAFYALGDMYRRGHNRSALLMMLAIALYLLTATQGILARLSIIHSVPLGTFGYLAMVIVMSMVLNHERKQQLRMSESRFRSLVEQSPFSIQILAPDGRTLQVNAAWEKLWGVKAQGIGSYNILTDRRLENDGVMPYIKRGFSGIATEIPPVVYGPAHDHLQAGAAGDRWVRAYIYPIREHDGAIREAILMHEDVTEKKRVEDAIRLIAASVSAETDENFFKQLMRSLTMLLNAKHAFIGVLDEHDNQRINTLAFCNDGRIVDNISYSLIGTPCANVVGKGTCIYPRAVQTLFPQDAGLADMDADGYIGTPLFDAHGTPLGLMAVLDTKPFEHTEQLQEVLEIFAARASAEVQRLHAEAHIRRMAYQDYLTGLASRAYLQERLSQMVQRTHQSNEGGALLLIDLDHFKTINDALGHDVGDQVLRSVAALLVAAVGDDGFISRTGGDEFVVLVTGREYRTAQGEQHAAILAQKIVDTLSTPIFVDERAFNVGASIGVVLFPDDDDTEGDIMRRADMALYRAKNLGRGVIEFYRSNLQEAATNRLRLEEGLRRVIANNELELHFQPQVDADGRMVGAEALLRWHHPELGEISPAIFIPVAEETGLIHGIGSWVLEQACSKLAQWLRDGIEFNGHLSVNVCPWQFARPDFVDQVRRTLATHEIDVRHLTLELTETALLYDIKETIEKLQALRALGLTVALDDFGTGYSSLAYLKDLPLDLIKIDKAFVNEISTGSEHRLLESIIAISGYMRLGVIAEGVESTTQRDVLIGLGCKHFQGYLFSRPLPENNFLEWISRQGTAA